MDAAGHKHATETAVYRLDLAYEGTPFKGWARQPGQTTVEGLLEDALRVALRRPVRVRVAGRTDAGVHAMAQVASFALPAGDGPGPAALLDPRRLRLTLNALLPPEVVVTAVAPASPGFDARAARSRTYRYRLWLSEVRPVHERAYVWSVRGSLDPAVLDRAAHLLLGRKDFAALTPSAHLYHHCVREVLVARWLSAADPPASPEHVFEIRATSFLHNMVRVAVGSMVDVAQGRLTLEAFAEGLASGERRRMGQTAPARGLMLVAVEY